MARKKRQPEPESGGDDFMLMFTALMIIVLAFFILLTTMAVIDDDKSRLALGSLRGSFGILPGGLVFDNKGKVLERSNHLIDEIAILERMIKDMIQVVHQRQLGSKGYIELDKGGAFPKLRISSQVLYPDGGIEISPRSFPVLDILAQTAKDLDRVMVIEGHTGVEPPAAESVAPSNWELGALRAVNIQRYLITAAGVAPESVVSEGLAQYRPRPDLAPYDEVVIVFRAHERADHAPDADPGVTKPR